MCVNLLVSKFAYMSKVSSYEWGISNCNIPGPMIKKPYEVQITQAVGIRNPK